MEDNDGRSRKSSHSLTLSLPQAQAPLEYTPRQAPPPPIPIAFLPFTPPSSGNHLLTSPCTVENQPLQNNARLSSNKSARSSGAIYLRPPSRIDGAKDADPANAAVVASARRLQSAFVKLPHEFLELTKSVAAALPLERPVPLQAALLLDLADTLSDPSDAKSKDDPCSEPSPTASANTVTLTCPKRPKWRYNMTKEMVEKNESALFKKWLDQTDDAVDAWCEQKNSRVTTKGTGTEEAVVMPHAPTSFERNIEVWRQLFTCLHPAVHGQDESDNILVSREVCTYNMLRRILALPLLQSEHCPARDTLELLVPSPRKRTKGKPRIVNHSQLRRDIPFRVSRAYEISLEDLEDDDCKLLKEDETLIIYETKEIPDDVDYVTVSYPWVGVQRKNPAKLRFTVGRKKPYGDAINTDLLFSLCSWVLKSDVHYIWIDRLCICQGDDDDIAWQVKHMADIFKSSTFCTVLPNGLQHWFRSTSTKESPWMSRMWTLMEVLVAPKTQVLYQKVDNKTGKTKITSSLIEDWLCEYPDVATQHSRLLLLDALSWRDLFSKNKMSEEMLYFRNRTIWRCALLREATLPTDLLPSMLCVLSDTNINKPWFKEKVADPQCKDVDVLAFRDAVSSTGSDMSGKWKRLINSMNLPTMSGMITRLWRALSPCLMRKFDFEGIDVQITNAYRVSIDEVKDKELDISYVAKPRAYRLLDCKQYCDKKMMVVYEFNKISNLRYATLSYPWVGVPCHHVAANGYTFWVKQDDGRQGDPISTETLRLACKLALKKGAEYLWIDRLCVVQADATDKSYQIHHMGDIYKDSSLCIVLPGGLQRLVGLHEETPWISRKDRASSSMLKAFSSDRKRLELFEDGEIYYIPLHYLTEDSRNMNIRVLGNPEYGFAHILHKAIDSRQHSRKHQESYTQKFQRYLATWKSAMTRSSDRPQDLLLSTMCIFDISLEEGVQRSQDCVFAAFVKELRKEGIKDVRIVAFKEAVHKSHLSVSVQWKHLINALNQCVPLLPGGVSPISNTHLPLHLAGHPVTRTRDGRKIFLGSALVVSEESHALEPCQVVVKNTASFSCLVQTDSPQKKHDGRFEIQPFDSRRMRWMTPFDGKVPSGRSPVQGGYDRSEVLYHALVTVKDNSTGRRERFLGKASSRLKECHYLSDADGNTSRMTREYKILCWRRGCGPSETGNGNSSASDTDSDVTDSEDDDNDEDSTCSEENDSESEYECENPHDYLRRTSRRIFLNSTGNYPDSDSNSDSD
ncbi:hypothetical protein QCA50_016360 [Cerrena zonata]|uniref:Heterokaryon incompatibility domain-containing protein n=1 Tax=Cerrena zonata TaxID=2478898 RepID=A0AAW0FHK4_9APHY